ncbi:MAG: FHA domain-containing protein [Cyanobacteria bacterium RU_5_0]|nr:FHA domain-containing protein [Cyanobacteria bacterium RU_5_0]
MLAIKIFNNQTGEFRKTTLNPATTPQGECIIGRSSTCDLILASPEVSRVHGRIKVQDNVYYYSDLGSTDGSRLNNELAKVNQSFRLNEGDILRVGEFVLLVEAIEKPESTGKSTQGSSQSQAWQDDIAVQCVRVTDETADVKTFSFAAESTMLFSYKPGQFVTLELEINGETIYRSYSISSTPSRPHLLEVTVKRVSTPVDAPDAPPGLVSNWLHDNIKVGSKIKISEPRGKFTCASSSAQKLLLISAGSGITPMMSMSRWIADMGSDRDIVFLHSARSPRDIIFRQELEMMAARLPNFRLAVTTTQSAAGHAWMGFKGRFDETMLRSIAPDFQERTVYVCGPEKFMQGVKTTFEGLGFPMQNYHEESFGVPKKTKKSAATVTDPIVTPPVQSPALELNGVTALVTTTSPAVVVPSVPALVGLVSQPAVFFAQSEKEVAAEGEESILELAEQEGVKIRSSCRQGVCGACKKRKLEGEVRYETEPDALDQSEQDAGFILTCVACPVGRVVVEA